MSKNEVKEGWQLFVCCILVAQALNAKQIVNKLLIGEI